MMFTRTTLIRVPFVIGSLLASTMMLMGPAEAQQSGLVNVNIDNVTVQIPIAAAANLCGVSVLVLAQQLPAGGVDCQSGTISLAQEDDGSGGNVDQEGLINVNITNVDAQVPISIAANVCDVAVDILAAALLQGPVDCRANGQAATVSS
jgi:hypothetical protein